MHAYDILDKQLDRGVFVFGLCREIADLQELKTVSLERDDLLGDARVESQHVTHEVDQLHECTRVVRHQPYLSREAPLFKCRYLRLVMV